MMETKNGFTRFDTINEFKNWLNKQNIRGKINKLQVHHTYSPSYDNWPENELTRQYNIKKYHTDTNGWSDIGQHFTIFPNGKIVTGWSLNNDPAGIKGWNTNAICIEIYGNFDRNNDIMNNEQKEAVIACYGLLCKKFNITPSMNTIRCHGWFTSSGTYLGAYNKSKSCKTCPGTNFMGVGNTKSAFVKNFYPKIKDYMSECEFINGSTSTSENTNSIDRKSYTTGIYRVKVKGLNIRKSPGTNYDIVGVIRDKGSYTIVKISGSWGYLKSKAGWINISNSYCSKVR